MCFGIFLVLNIFIVFEYSKIFWYIDFLDFQIYFKLLGIYSFSELQIYFGFLVLFLDYNFKFSRIFKYIGFE